MLTWKPTTSTPQAFAWATAAALLAASAGVRAAEPGPDTLPLTILAIQTVDADDQAEALTKVLRSAVRTVPGWSLAAGDYSLEVLSLTFKCSEPPDARCLSLIADQIQTDRFVWGTLRKKDKRGTSVVADLHLWVRGQGTSHWPMTYSTNLTDQNDEALRAIGVEAIAQLTGGPPKGAIHVTAGNVAGQVFVDGQPMGALQQGEVMLTVPSGLHKVTVKAVGFADQETQVMVRPTGLPRKLVFTMIPSEERSPVQWRSVGGYAALGVGVVAAVLGVVSMVRVKGIQDNLTGILKGQPTDFDVCDKTTYGKHLPPVSPSADNPFLAEASCSQGTMFMAVQATAFPLAALAGGAGIFLLATGAGAAPGPAQARWRVLPHGGPQGGGVDLTYTF